ncbi:MAG: peptide chain release factor 2 [bacterium]|nr:peptide chain release factor 2 [bacterium]
MSLGRGTIFDLDKRKAEARALEAEMNQPQFWNDREAATQKSQRLAELKNDIRVWDELFNDTRDATELCNLAEREGDASLGEELISKATELSERFRTLELQLLFSGEYDDRNAFLSIHAGTGGTEAQDWAEMLLRMVTRYCEKKGWRVTTDDLKRGEEAGIKSATLHVEGRHAYGHLKAEAGTHRLVRLSPFDADHARHTSFALIEALPELDETPDIEIKPDDIRIDVFLAGGHGGQSVQTTYSAVRIVHLSTGITVSCQNERSQMQNKETAMKILRGRLWDIQQKEREEEKSRLRGEHKEAAWGNQIRSYVLHPYHMVKDLRTQHETSDTQGVLDGELEPFIEAYLRWKKERG